MGSGRPWWSAFRSRDFALFWAGGVISNSGSWMQNLAVPYVVFQQTHSAWWVGVGTACQFLPAALASLFGGFLADTKERRKLLIVLHLALTVVGVGLWWLVRSSPGSVGWMLVVVGIMGALWGLAMPAWQSLVPDLVPPSDLVSAVSLNTVQFNLARAIGPAVAGVVIALGGPAPAFAANAASYLVSGAALVLVRARSHPVPARLSQFSAQLKSAINYSLAQPAVRSGIGVTAIVILIGSPVYTLPVIFSATVFHVGPAALGFLTAATALGAVLAVPYLIGHESSLSSAVRQGMAFLGLGTLLLGVVPNTLLAGLALILVGIGYVAGNSAVMSALQLAVDPALRGRVLALRVTTTQTSIALGGLILGWLTQTAGARWAAVLWGLTALVTALAMTRGPGGRVIRALDDKRI